MTTPSNPTEQEMIAHGKAVFEQCYNGVVPLPPQIDPAGFSGQTMKMFHEIWGGVDLPMREKRLIVMGVLAGLGADPNLFRIHAESALRNGEMDEEDVRRVVVMALPYVGYPRASPLLIASETLIAERKAQAAKSG